MYSRKNDEGDFIITSVCRDDLIKAGFSAEGITDEQMLELANKMAQTYLENSFWIDLRLTAEYLGGIFSNTIECPYCGYGMVRVADTIAALNDVETADNINIIQAWQCTECGWWKAI